MEVSNLVLFITATVDMFIGFGVGYFIGKWKAESKAQQFKPKKETTQWI